jgi:hypothetical protein
MAIALNASNLADALTSEFVGGWQPIAFSRKHKANPTSYDTQVTIHGSKGVM